MTRRRRSPPAYSQRSRAGSYATRQNTSHPAHHRRLRFEPLEDRRLLAVFTVDNLGDAGPGSLRRAIDDANAAVGADTIEFQAGLAGTIALSTGQMTITDELTIDGPGATELTIDAQLNSRIFYVDATSGPVIFEGLTLTGGNALSSGGAIFSETSEPLSIQSSMISGNSANPNGGGIFADGDVTVTGSTISDNSTTDISRVRGGGGGIYADGDVTVTSSTISGNSTTGEFTGGGGIFALDGDVTVTDSTISGNSTTDRIGGPRGGGIYADGDVTVTDSTISGNSATGPGTVAGGGIAANGDVTITGSSISGNSATSGLIGAGGGILAYGDVTVTGSTISSNSATNDGLASGGGGILALGGNATITGSTISGNSALGSLSFGGGIWDGALLGFGANVTVTLSTISGNSALGNPFLGDAGGGISAIEVAIENSIVAGNNTNTGTAPDLNPGTGPLSVRYSLIGNNTDTGLAEAPVGMPDANGNLIGDPDGAGIIDPLLDPLQDNGGPTETHALLPGSPAINAGDPAFAPPPDFDQRGDPFVRVFDGRIDMGAFEVQPPNLEAAIQQLLDDGVLNRGQANSLLVKLNSAGNERAQMNRLGALINEVNAFVRAGILSEAEGQSLIDAAEALRASISNLGDANGDGLVNAGDYTAWANQFGDPGPGQSADFNSDGVVNAGDYTLWANNFGVGVSTSAAPAAAPLAVQEDAVSSEVKSSTVAIDSVHSSAEMNWALYMLLDDMLDDETDE